MNRLSWALLGVLALSAALACTPAPAAESESLVSAFSQSLGGLRVFVVDLLFLRAERARTVGDMDRARGLYKTLLQMQPDNPPATAHLIDIEFDMLGYIVDEDERLAQWVALRRQLAQAMRLRPASARLRYRDAQLILDALRRNDTALKGRLTEVLGEPRALALRRLTEAASLADSIPRLASVHLATFCLQCVEVAADALARGRTQLLKQAIAWGRTIYDLRADTLQVMRRAKEVDGDLRDPATSISFHDFLGWGLATVEAVAAAPHRAAARTAIDVFVARAGDDLRAVAILRDVAARKPDEQK